MSSANFAIPSSTTAPTGWAGGSKLSRRRPPFMPTRHSRNPRPQGRALDAEVSPRTTGSAIPRDS